MRSGWERAGNVGIPPSVWHPCLAAVVLATALSLLPGQPVRADCTTTPDTAPSPVYPAPGEVGVPLSPTLQWTAVADNCVDYYYASIFTTSGSFVWESLYAWGTSAQVPPGLLQEESYYNWYAWAHNSNGWGPQGGAWAFSTSATACTAVPGSSPDPVSPAPYAVGVPLQPTLRWTAVSNDCVDEYFAAVYTVSGSHVWSLTTRSTSAVVPSCTLQQGGDYNWYAWAHNWIGWGPQGGPWGFSTSFAPGEVSPGDSIDSAETWSGDKTTLSWQAPCEAVEGYRLYRGVPADLPNLVTGADDSCTRYDGASLSFSLSETNDQPSTGSFLWFLVTAYSGAGEGSAGDTTAASRNLNSSGVCQ